MEETKEGKIKSPGSLIHTQADDCENARVTVEEVPVGDLAFDNALPDYRDETSFPMPIAVKAKGDSRHYIVDGRALDAGEATVTCLVYHVDQLDDTELALRKFAVRIAPIGSTARYPEILRNVCLLEQKLPPSSTNSKAYTAGGDRKSEDFRDDPQQAFLDHLRRQPVQVGLERIQGGRSVREDAGAPLHRCHLDGQDLGHQPLDGRIAQVQPVAGQVEMESVALLGDGQAAQLGFSLEQDPRPV